MKTRTKKLLDFLPLVVLMGSAIYLTHAYLSGTTGFLPRHITGLVLLPIPTFLFFVRHKLGVLTLGLVLLSGALGAVSYSPAISTHSFGIHGPNGPVTLLVIQPIFLFWLALHFAVSGRYYTGIMTKQYWQQLDSDESYFTEADENLSA